MTCSLHQDAIVDPMWRVDTVVPSFNLARDQSRLMLPAHLATQSKREATLQEKSTFALKLAAAKGPAASERFASVLDDFVGDYLPRGRVPVANPPLQKHQRQARLQPGIPNAPTGKGNKKVSREHKKKDALAKQAKKSQMRGD